MAGHCYWCEARFNVWNINTPKQQKKLHEQFHEIYQEVPPWVSDLNNFFIKR